MNWAVLFVPRHCKVEGAASFTMSFLQGAPPENAVASVPFVVPAIIARYMHVPKPPGTMMSPGLYVVEMVYAKYSGLPVPGAFNG
jgi:hypothetical protein